MELSHTLAHSLAFPPSNAKSAASHSAQLLTSGVCTYA